MRFFQVFVKWECTSSEAGPISWGQVRVNFREPVIAAHSDGESGVCEPSAATCIRFLSGSLGLSEGFSPIVLEQLLVNRPSKLIPRVAGISPGCTALSITIAVFCTPMHSTMLFSPQDACLCLLPMPSTWHDKKCSGQPLVV